MAWKTMVRGTIVDGQTKTEIDISSLSKDVYLFVFMQNDSVIRRKLKKMKFCISLIIVLLMPVLINAQQNARNGSYFAPYGTVNVLIVFADVTDDTIYHEIPGWTAGQLPDFADSIVDDITGGITTYVTKYFKEASRGKLIVVGDYYPRLLTFHLSEMLDFGRINVAKYLDTVSDEIITMHGHRLEEFDMWKLHPYVGYNVTENTQDNMIDILYIVWRHNSTRFPTPSGGSTSTDYVWPEYFVRNFVGFNTIVQSCHNDPAGVLRHEFAHKLLGDNNYHSGGAGAGEGTFLSNIGGYSMLGSHNKNLDSYNGWDCWWLGWKPSTKSYYISALDNSGSEISADFVYGDPHANGIFTLRNFAETGDAIRIKLPYLKSINSRTKNQYLWIENHQINRGTIEYEDGKTPDIRINIQVGNDSLDKNFFKSTTNYFSPLSSFGNYDFSCVPFDTSATMICWYDAYTSDTLTNPFTGYHPLMFPAWDAELSSASTQIDNEIESNEYLTIHRVYKDGDGTNGHLPIFGNRYDAFHVGAALGITTNPSITPVLTYKTTYRSSAAIPYPNPMDPDSSDNRYIFLNGLRVDIIDKNPTDGSIRVRIRCDDFTVNRDVRWCGPIILTEKVELAEERKITLDYGLMPTRPYNPVTLHGRKVFADPTVFVCRSGSLFHQYERSKVEVTNRSTLVVEDGAVYQIEDGAELRIKNEGTLLVRSGGKLIVKGRGHVEIEDDGFVCFENGARIDLDDVLSTVNLSPGFTQGTCYNILPLSQNNNCTTPILNFPHRGSGSINLLEGDMYIQNKVFFEEDYITGNTIRAGNHVTGQIPTGNVIVPLGADIILHSQRGTTLENGFEVQFGGKLEVR